MFSCLRGRRWYAASTMMIMGMLAIAGPAPGEMIISIDLDRDKPGIQDHLEVAPGDEVKAGLVFEVGPEGVSAYSVSVRFDTSELLLLDLPGSPGATNTPPQLLTAASDFIQLTVDDGSGLAQLSSFDAISFGGPADIIFEAGVISFRADAPADGSTTHDIQPGQFDVSFDGILDNADELVTAIFEGASITLIPEPTTISCLLGASMLVLSGRRRVSWW